MINYNFLCFLTLVKKEVLRFLKVGIQTVIGPAISSLLFLAVFSLALGRSVNSINGIDLPYFHCTWSYNDDYASKLFC